MISQPLNSEPSELPRFSTDEINPKALPAPDPEAAIVPQSVESKRDALEQLHKVFGKWLHIPEEDRDIIDVCLATYRSNKLSGEKLWLMTVDASGGGKTELLRPLCEREDSYFLGRISPKAVSSGYRDKDNKGKDPSILPQLNGKVFIIKDLSPILSMKSADRREVLGTLRDVYDGFMAEAKGNLGRLEYRVSFTCITATTLAIENFTSVEQELGERFIKIRACGSGDSDISKVSRAFANAPKTEEMRQEIQAAVNQFLDSLPSRAEVTCGTRANAAEIVKIANFTARARSHVSRDHKGELQYHPRTEVGTRLVQEMFKLCVGLAIVRGRSAVNEADLKTLRRVAADCLPINRRLILDILRKNPGQRTSEVEEASGLPRSTVKRVLDDLYLLGVVSRTEEGELGDDTKIYSWALASD